MSINFKTESLESEAARQLYQLLSRISFLRVERPKLPNRNTNITSAPVATFLVEAGKLKRKIVLEVKKNAQLRDARNTVFRLEKAASTLGEQTYTIFASQYLSQSVRDYCTENEVGYLDLSGNCHIEFDQVFIERLMPDADKREKKQFKSLFKAKSSRVVRRLLANPSRQWRVNQLALEAGVSPATVSLVKDRLMGDNFAAWQGETFSITQPTRLLQQWSKQYQSQDNLKIECYADGTVEELEKKFASYCTTNGISYAFTSFSGAKRVASSTRGVVRSYAFLAPETDIANLLEDLKFKLVDSGGNFTIMVPSDEDLLFDTQVVGNEVVVSDIQLYLDLCANPARGEEAAEYLLDTRINRQW
ncbi:MAG: type IV toxin-antitoxin system AbiEi family antitoxin [Candidatus Obscuribacterales bacterium]